MSTYPGETPQPADDAPQDTPADTDLTQPVGYWERQAAEQDQQGHSGTATDPQAAHPSSAPQNAPQGLSQNPYDQIPGVNPYGPYTPGAQQQGQPYAGPPYGQPAGYPPQPGQPASYAPVPPGANYAPVALSHPQATTAMVLGLVALVGSLVLCGLPLLVSPFAWFIGGKAVREIKASQGRLGGESQARAGQIMGIIGTVLLVLAILAVIVFVVVIVATGTTDPTTGSSV